MGTIDFISTPIFEISMTYICIIFVSVFRYTLFLDKLRVKIPTLCTIYFTALTIMIFISYKLNMYETRETANNSRTIIYLVMTIISFLLIKDFKSNYLKQLFAICSLSQISTFVVSLIIPLEPILVKKYINCYDIFLSLILLVTFITFIPIIKMLFYKPFKNIIDVDIPKIWAVTTPFILILSLINMILLTGVKNFLLSDRLMFRIIINFNGVFVSLLTLNLLNRVYDIMSLKNKLKISQEYIDMQSKYYNSLEDNYEITRKMRHDLRHHLVVIKGLTEQGNNLQTLEYINSIIQDVASIENLLICHNENINIILNRYKHLCDDNNIIFDTKVSIPNEPLFISPNDICVLISNLIENSYEACMRQQDTTSKKCIKIRSEYMCDRFIFIISNTFNNQIEVNNGKYISSKENRYGLGTQSVQTICKKYDGFYDVSITKSIFQSKVLLHKY